jgi:hypothetical protein
MDKKISSLDAGPIISISNLEEALNAQNIGAGFLLFKRKDILDIKNISEILKNIDIKLIVPCKPNNNLEAKVLKHIGVEVIYEQNESKEENLFLDKNLLDNCFICDGFNLGYCLRRISEGASMLMVKTENLNLINDKLFEFNKYKNINSMIKFSKEENVPLDLVKVCSELNKLPVPIICSSNITNVFEIVSVKNSKFNNFIIDSSILNSNKENLDKIEKVLKSDDIDDISLVLGFFNMKDTNSIVNENDIIESNMSSELVSIDSIESSELDLSDK